MSNSTTVLEQIVTLSEAEQQLLNKDEWDTGDHRRCADIQATLVKLWVRRRAELVYQRAGPPRLLSAPDPRSQPQVRRFAQSGGD